MSFSKMIVYGLAIVLLPIAGYLYALSPANIYKQFHIYSYDDHDTWRKNHWLGVSTHQNPNDVWVTQEIISEVKPDVIIETGTSFGGSSVIWAMILEQVNPNGKVITVDIEDTRSKVLDIPIYKERVEFMLGSSTDPAIIMKIKEQIEGKRVLVILDSDHSKSHVANELELYGPMVSKGSYMIVQDTNVNGNPAFLAHGPGPMEAVLEYLPKNSQFVIDKERERLLYTMHPNGYLKKVS